MIAVRVRYDHHIEQRQIHVQSFNVPAKHLDIVTGIEEKLQLFQISSLLESRGTRAMQPLIEDAISFNVNQEIGLFVLDVGVIPV